MSKKTVNTNFEICDDKSSKFILYIEIEEKENSVIISAATLSSYFHDQLLLAGKNRYPNKKIEIAYSSFIKMDYYSFKKFKEIVYP